MKTETGRMKLTSLLFTVALSGCASLTNQSSNPNACQVWTDDPAQTVKVAVENDAAFYGAGCITGRFGCKWKEVKFDGDYIVADGELASRHGKVASYKDGVFTQVLDGVIVKAMGSTMINQEKFEFQKDRVVYTVKYTGLAKSIARKDVGVINYFHSPQCTPREVALGVGFFLSGRK
jgi:hypothetical protein